MNIPVRNLLIFIFSLLIGVVIYKISIWANNDQFESSVNQMKELKLNA